MEEKSKTRRRHHQTRQSNSRSKARPETYWFTAGSGSAVQCNGAKVAPSTNSSVAEQGVARTLRQHTGTYNPELPRWVECFRWTALDIVHGERAIFPNENFNSDSGTQLHLCITDARSTGSICPGTVVYALSLEFDYGVGVGRVRLDPNDCLFGTAAVETRTTSENQTTRSVCNLRI